MAKFVCVEECDRIKYTLDGPKNVERMWINVETIRSFGPAWDGKNDLCPGITRIVLFKSKGEVHIVYSLGTPEELFARLQGKEDCDTATSDPLLGTHIRDLRFSARLRKVLNHTGVRTLADLVKFTEKDLCAYKGFGAAALEQTREMLWNKGLHLAGE